MTREDKEALYMIHERNGTRAILAVLDKLRELSNEKEYEKALEAYLSER